MQRFVKLALLIAPALAAPSAPVAARGGGCSTAFDGWTLTDLEYHASYIFTTPSHQNSYGYVSFNVVNPATDYIVACSAQSSQLQDFFYGTQVFTCPTPIGSGGKVSFTYNRANNEVALNQTWVCRDDPQWPATFNAGGSASANLACTDNFWQNPDWQMGQTYSSRQVTCDPVNLHVPSAWMNGVA